MKRNNSSTVALSVKVTGGEAVGKRMNALKKNVQEAIFVRAVQPSLKVIADDAKRGVQGVSSKSGGSTRTLSAIASRIAIKLQRSQGSRYFSKGRVAVFYGRPRGTVPKQEAGKQQPLWARASLAHLIEYGFRLTHFFGRKIRTRRIAERPFMRPAFERNKDKAERLFTRVLRDELRKVEAQ